MAPRPNGSRWPAPPPPPEDTDPGTEPAPAAATTTGDGWLAQQLLAELRTSRKEAGGHMRSITSELRGARVEQRYLVGGLLATLVFAIALVAATRGVDPRVAAEAARAVLAPTGPAGP